MPDDIARNQRAGERLTRTVPGQSTIDDAIRAVDSNSASIDALSSKADQLAQQFAISENARNRDRIIYIALLLMLLSLTATSVFTSVKASEASHTNQQILREVLNVTSPSAQVASNARTAALVAKLEKDVEHCQANRIDHDLLGKPSDPACAG